MDGRLRGNIRLKGDGNGRMWFVAWLLTLAFHAILVFAVQKFSPLHAAPATTREPDPIQLVFTDPAPTASTTDEPHLFTELPADRADAAPEKPQFLSNVTSRARDRVPGGDKDLPKLEGDADAPSVRTASEGTPSQAPAAAGRRSPDPAGVRDAQPQQRSAAEPDPGSSPTPGTEPLTHVEEEALRGEPESSVNDQPEMMNPTGNAALFGDVSLNTIAWDYAPWLQRFIRQLKRRWYAPPAYTLGILKEGGWALIEVEISKSGELLRLDLLEERGHPSLIRSAEGALRSVPPIEPLPAGFPEPTLILRIRMIYPRFTPR